MKLTRRGWAMVALIVALLIMAWLFGARALNAVVAPAVIALLVGVVQLTLSDPPTVERTQPQAGFPDEQRTISLSIDGPSGMVFSGQDTVGAGLVGGGGDFEGTAPLEDEYDLRLSQRGRHELGPARIVVRDALGLLSTEYQAGSTTDVLVYPRLVNVTGSELVATVFERNRTAIRGEFDQVREYVPGDPLRDINWKASAKRLPDLIVTEYVDRQADSAVTIAGEADDANVDTVASAVASLGMCLLDRGLSVAVAVPDGNREAGRSEQHRSAILELLAETGPGTIDAELEPGPIKGGTETDIHIDGRGDPVSVTIEGRTMPWTDVGDMSAESDFRSIGGRSRASSYHEGITQ